MIIKRASLLLLAVLLLPGLAWAQEGTRNTFLVAKFYTDYNPNPVDVTLSCNTGLPLEQTKTIDPVHLNLDYVDFVVVDFDSGEMDCEVTEAPIPGYSTVYFYGNAPIPLPTNLAEAEAGVGSGVFEYSEEGCFFEDVEDEAQTRETEYFCLVVNLPDPVIVTVNKEWVYSNTSNNEISDEYRIYLQCNAEIEGGYDIGGGTWRAHWDSEGDDFHNFTVYVEYGGASCSATESVYDSAVESDDSDCQGLSIDIAQGAECTIVNTVFFEGIPTLNQYGLAVLALLMLGVGFVGFRRFA